VLPLPEDMGSRCVVFPWLTVVAAHDLKILAQALCSSARHWLYKTCPYTQVSFGSVIFYPSLQTVQKTVPLDIALALTISTAQRKTLKRAEVYPPSYVFFPPVANSTWHIPDPSYDNAASTITVRQWHCV